MLLLGTGLFSDQQNISWNEPELRGLNQISFLQKNEEKITSYPLALESVDTSQFFFSLHSWHNFKLALRDFMANTQPEDRTFLQYYSPGSSKSADGIHSDLHSPAFPPLSYFKLSLYTGIDLVSDTDDSYYFYYFGSHLSGTINRKLDFYADWWKGHFSGDLPYAGSSQLLDCWTQTNSDSTELYLDNVKGRIQYRISPWWTAAVGRGKYQIGNNIGGSIILNDHANDYGYVSTKFRFRDFGLSFLHAALVADSTKGGYKDYPDKYLATHQFHWQVHDKLELFLGEHLIYGDRSMDLNYLLPLSFWRITEHNLYDRDNVLIFAGANWRVFNSHLAYFNVVIDELSTGELLHNWWGNKYAVQTGYSYRCPRQRDNRLTLEFTAIRPWLYTHKYIHTKFSQSGRSLGFPAGSNLIQFAAELNYHILSNLSLNLHGSFTRQGSVGNDFSINYENRDKSLDNATHWLEGEIENTIASSFICNWDPLTHHGFKLALVLTQAAENDMTQEIFFSYQARY